MPAERIKSVWAPAGLDLGAASPEEIALSIISQIVVVRRGGNALPLKEKAAHIAAVDEGRDADNVIRQCDASNVD